MNYFRTIKFVVVIISFGLFGLIDRTVHAAARVAAAAHEYAHAEHIIFGDHGERIISGPDGERITFGSPSARKKIKKTKKIQEVALILGPEEIESGNPGEMTSLVIQALDEKTVPIIALGAWVRNILKKAEVYRPYCEKAQAFIAREKAEGKTVDLEEVIENVIKEKIADDKKAAEEYEKKQAEQWVLLDASRKNIFAVMDQKMAEFQAQEQRKCCFSARNFCQKLSCSERTCLLECCKKKKPKRTAASGLSHSDNEKIQAMVKKMFAETREERTAKKVASIKQTFKLGLITLKPEDWHVYYHKLADIVLLVPTSYVTHNCSPDIKEIDDRVQACGFSVKDNHQLVRLDDLSLKSFEDRQKKDVFGHKFFSDRNFVDQVSIPEALRSMFVKSPEFHRIISWFGHGFPPQKTDALVKNLEYRLKNTQRKLEEYQKYVAQAQDIKSGKVEAVEDKPSGYTKETPDQLEIRLGRLQASVIKLTEQKEMLEKLLKKLENLSKKEGRVFAEPAFMAGMHWYDFVQTLELFKDINTVFVNIYYCFAGGCHRPFVEKTLNDIKAPYTTVTFGMNEYTVKAHLIQDVPMVWSDDNKTLKIDYSYSISGSFAHIRALYEPLYGPAEASPVLASVRDNAKIYQALSEVLKYAVWRPVIVSNQQPFVWVPHVGKFRPVPVDENVMILDDSHENREIKREDRVGAGAPAAPVAPVDLKDPRVIDIRGYDALVVNRPVVREPIVLDSKTCIVSALTPKLLTSDIVSIDPKQKIIHGIKRLEFIGGPMANSPEGLKDALIQCFAQKNDSFCKVFIIEECVSYASDDRSYRLSGPDQHFSHIVLRIDGGAFNGNDMHTKATIGYYDQKARKIGYAQVHGCKKSCKENDDCGRAMDKIFEIQAAKPTTFWQRCCSGRFEKNKGILLDDAQAKVRAEFDKLVKLDFAEVSIIMEALK